MSARHYGVKGPDHNPGFFVEDVGGLYSDFKEIPFEYQYVFLPTEKGCKEYNCSPFEQLSSNWCSTSQREFLKSEYVESIIKFRKREAIMEKES